MKTPPRPDPKRAALEQSGTLNPHPDTVSDPVFRAQEFFDGRDLVQVKYEMLRRVQVEGRPIAATAAAFGFSRITLYQLQQRFAAEGLAGLLPQPRGPHQGHKLTDELVTFLQDQRTAEPRLRTADLQQRLVKRYGLVVDPRTIERALARRAKKR